MQLPKNVTAVQALIIACLVMMPSACSSTSGSKSISSENVSGGYLAPAGSQWYRTQNGALLAWDGSNWYQLIRPQREGGSVGGFSATMPEKWVRVGESLNQSYQRTMATYKDQSLRPVFMPY